MTNRLAPLLLLLTAAAIAAAAGSAVAQNPPPADRPPDRSSDTSSSPVYKPPLRGAPGGRVGGASRSAVRVSAPLPTIELLAPADHAGVTATPTPTLLFFVSRSVDWPTQFTISAPLQPKPVLEVTIPSPRAAGIYALRPAKYEVRLRPGIVYTWSVSIVLDPHAWSRNIVASGTILLDPTNEPAADPRLPPRQRAALLAGAGLWYDAIAAAAEVQNLDRHAALDALIKQAGLTEAGGYAQSMP